MEAKDVVELYNLFQENGIEIWIDGGWGIDALLEKQTRPHNDLDIAVDHKYVLKFRKLLEDKGYKEINLETSKDYNFVLRNENGNEVDVHVFQFNDKWKNVYGIPYPVESLTGEGTINGRKVKCIAAEFVIIFHSYYEPQEKDYQDIKALCEKFNLPQPKKYKKS